jgi:hypothetical protein
MMAAISPPISAGQAQDQEASRFMFAVLEREQTKSSFQKYFPQ